MHDATDPVDVVVVGAGISGLTVADRVVAAGRCVVVVEARGRPGGRLLSAAPSFDLGATWFWDGEHRVAALVDRFAAPTFAQHLDGDTLVDDSGGVHRLAGNLLDVPAHRFATGAAHLATALASTLPADTIRYDCPVDTITIDVDGLLRLTSNDHTWRARHVALALPPALAVATIQLPDALPGELRRVGGATPVWMGQTAKVVAVYDEPFWRIEGLAGAAVSRIGPLQEIHDMSGPAGQPAALFGFAPAAALGPDTRERVLGQLGRMFGPRASQPERLLIHDWSRETYTSPALPDSPAPPGVSRGNYALFGHRVYQQPSLGGRLHWCSTETATVSPGHIEGALEAAERTATAILGNHH